MKNEKGKKVNESEAAQKSKRQKDSQPNGQKGQVQVSPNQLKRDNLKEKQTDTQTDKQTDRQTDLIIERHVGSQ